jgi:two-component system sensor histidine kinase HydH
LKEETGAFVGYVVLFRDLSEIQRLKEEVARNQRLAAVGRLAAGVAHEIRNPLSSIKGFATYFKERYREVPQDQKTAEIMIQEVDRLNRVIGQLLEFARPMSIRKTKESIPKIIRQTLKLVEGDARRRGIELRTNIPADFPKVMFDADKIKQVLMNLYLNGIEAMANGGTLTAEVWKDNRNQNAVIAIEDTGEGISMQNLPHVFDPFFTTKPSGTGLGLAIVHKTIESHGGEIKVEGRPGGGTRFTFWLPLGPSVREGVKA